MISSTNTKRIAKNTLALYARMLLNLVVSLYTARVAMAVLGLENYGIFSLVGSTIGLFSFLNASQNGATSRFFSFEMERGEAGRLPETFASAKRIHLIIALIVVVLLETAGLWYLNHKSVIPPERIQAARWAFQISIATAFIGIIQTPYVALIIAYEKMNIYAFIEMLQVILKLAVVYLLVIGNLDKLILYVLLLLCVSVVITLVYKLYCSKHYPESRTRFVWNKDIMKSLFSFSGYNIFGNMGSVINSQGTPMIVNTFFGVLYNAAIGAASTVSGAIEGFASNVLTAFRPQIIKDYAREDYKSFEAYLDLALKSILALYCFVTIPAFIEIDKVLSLWLVEVAPYTGTFCRLMLINIFFATLRYIVVIGIHATAKVKFVSIMTGILQILNPVIVWILLSKGMGVEYAYITIIFINIILCFICFISLQHFVPQIKVIRLVFSAILLLSVSLVSAAVAFYVSTLFEPSIYRILLTILVSSVCLLVSIWSLCLDRIQRLQIKEYVHGLFRKNANNQ